MSGAERTGGASATPEGKALLDITSATRRGKVAVVGSLSRSLTVAAPVAASMPQGGRRADWGKSDRAPPALGYPVG